MCDIYPPQPFAANGGGGISNQRIPNCLLSEFAVGWGVVFFSKAGSTAKKKKGPNVRRSAYKLSAGDALFYIYVPFEVVF